MSFSLIRRHCILLGLSFAATGLLPAWAAKPTAPTRATTILVVGDSLSAEYGLKRGTGWVALMEQSLAKDKIAATVVNASISGETTAGGRSRLAALLTQYHPTQVVVELGGNDALRGLPLSMTQDNLQAMTTMAQSAGAKVLLIGMQMPPNYGQDYNDHFAAMYATVAKANKAALVPFLLKGVDDQMFQNDRLHPKEIGHPIMLGNVLPVLKKMLP